MKFTKLIPLFVIILALSSCKKTDVANCTFNAQKVVLIYMAGDNNLSLDVNAEIAAITKSGNSYNGRVIIYADTFDKDPFLIEVRTASGAVVIDTLKKYPAQNSAAGQTLKEVINYVVTAAPAQSYGLILFSHGSGWLPPGTLKTLNQELILKSPAAPVLTYSMAQDNNNEMGLAEFAMAIPDNLFEYIIFENCFMSGVEIAAALENKAKWVMGSSAETLSPGFAPIYPALLSSLFNCRETVENNLMAFAKMYVNYFKNQQGAYQSATMSIFKTSEMRNLTAWVKTNAPYKNVDISGLQRFDRFANDHFFFDLQEYLTLISLPASHNELDNILNKMVVFKDATSHFMSGYPGTFDIIKHSGLTTYIPQDKYASLNEEYKTTRWYQMITN